MIYYIKEWTEKEGTLIPVYVPETEISEDLKDDEFKFVGELNSPEFENHFNENIVVEVK